jgi:tryptophan synthase beta chain
MADSPQTKFLLSEADLPTHWVNINPDMEALGAPMAPVLHPQTHAPVTPSDLAQLFPEALIAQEMSMERRIAIPEAVRDVYRLWRPTPLYRAHRWEAALGTPAKIFYKYEGTSPTGSHKPNTSVPQAFYNKEEGVRRLTTETGAGQWGSALSFATQMYGMACEVYMVHVSYDQKPYRRVMMQTWGATVTPSPSEATQAGRDVLAKDPDTTGSLGIAISEAVERAVQADDTKYALGSVLNHVLLHQTVIGQEVMRQLEDAGAGDPDVLVGCTGGGSNFAGFVYPFLAAHVDGRPKPHIVAVEPAATPSLTKGRYTYDYGDTAKMTPMVRMHTLGHDFVPPPIHSGGLRYHGMSPQVSALVHAGVVEAVSTPQLPMFEACQEFVRCEGILPAPEAGHAVWGARDQALKAKAAGEAKTIVFNLCGHGHFDLQAYADFQAGKLEDYAYPEAKVEKSLAALPTVEA